MHLLVTNLVSLAIFKYWVVLTSSNFTEYNSEANTDDGSCATPIVLGCTDNNFTEYNSEANTDDGSCATPIVLGCTDNNFTEYNSEANTDDGSCATAIILVVLTTTSLSIIQKQIQMIVRVLLK